MEKKVERVFGRNAELFLIQKLFSIRQRTFDFRVQRRWKFENHEDSFSIESQRKIQHRSHQVNFPFRTNEKKNWIFFFFFFFQLTNFMKFFLSLNSTTQAAMKNMLRRVASILNARASEYIDVRQHHIDEVLSNSIGDVRSSILNLIFNSLKGS